MYKKLGRAKIATSHAVQPEVAVITSKILPGTAVSFLLGGQALPKDSEPYAIISHARTMVEAL